MKTIIVHPRTGTWEKTSQQLKPNTADPTMAHRYLDLKWHNSKRNGQNKQNLQCTILRSASANNASREIEATLFINLHYFERIIKIKKRTTQMKHRWLMGYGADGESPWALSHSTPTAEGETSCSTKKRPPSTTEASVILQLGVAPAPPFRSSLT